MLLWNCKDCGAPSSRAWCWRHMPDHTTSDARVESGVKSLAEAILASLSEDTSDRADCVGMLMLAVLRGEHLRDAYSRAALWVAIGCTHTDPIAALCVAELVCHADDSMVRRLISCL